MFVYVADVARLYETVGDAAARAFVDAVLTHCRADVARSRGNIVKSMGEGLLATFEACSDAAVAASAMHRYIDANTMRFNRQMALKIGLCQGPLVRVDGDIFGDTVNVSARMSDLAVAHQTLAPLAAREHLHATQKGLVRTLGRFAVKGKSEPITVIELIWRTPDDMMEMTRSIAAPKNMGGLLIISYLGHDWRVSPVEPRLSLGRSADCDVVVNDPQASRLHAKLELRSDKFVLVDRSTNGTLLKIGQSPEVELHREEAILQGEGTIRFGGLDRSSVGETVHYRCT
jgi:adenylate cyclase